MPKIIASYRAESQLIFIGQPDRGIYAFIPLLNNNLDLENKLHVKIYRIHAKYAQLEDTATKHYTDVCRVIEIHGENIINASFLPTGVSKQLALIDSTYPNHKTLPVDPFSDIMKLVQAGYRKVIDDVYHDRLKEHLQNLKYKFKDTHCTLRMLKNKIHRTQQKINLLH